MTRPTGTRLKVLRGNPGKRPAGKARPAPPAGRPKVPQFLGAVARRKWRQLVPVLERIGVLTVVDGDVLACYCVAWQELEEATAMLAREGRTTPRGSGGLGPHPAIGLQRSALRVLASLAASLGLTPSSRRGWLDDVAKEKPDALAEWMNGDDTPSGRGA